MAGTKAPGQFYPGGEGASGPFAPPVPPTNTPGAGVQVVRERIDPRQLSVNIKAASGLVYRWGPDEQDASLVPTAIQIGTQIPGGFTTFDCTLARRPDLSYFDLDRFAPVTVTGAGGALTAFDGYLATRPMDRSAAYTFTPEAIGWSGHMKDDNSFSMVYIERQLSKWAGMGLARQAFWLSAGRDISTWSAQTNADQSGAGMLMTASGPFPANDCLTEEFYDAGALNRIAQMRIPSISGQNLSETDTANIVALYTASNDQAATFSGGNELPTISAIVRNFTAQRFALLQVSRDGTAGGTSSGLTYQWALHNIALVGDHGLTIHAGPSGVTPGVDDGFYGGDMIADVITRACPQLTVERGPGGIVDDHTPVTGNDSFVVPNMAFNTPISADAAVSQLNQFYLYDYGVYDRKRFFWRPAATGTEWHVRLAEGVKLQDQGPQIETAINGVIVSYSDPAGVNRFVGPPPGPWDTDPVTSATSSTALQDTSPNNPCNEYGRKRWPVLQMLGMSTWAGAVQVGSLYLQQMLTRKEAGSLRITGFAVDSNGNEWPVWMIHAGDTVIIDDFGTTDAGDLSHYILQTSYDHDTLTNTLTLDAPPNRVDWILQRLNLVIAPLG